MKKSTKFLTGLVLGTLMASSTAFAAEEAVGEFNLDQIIVTAQRMETRDLETPSAVQVMTSEDLQKTGATNLQDALRYGTGLMYQAQGAKGTSQGTMNSKIIIRGVEKGTLVLVDGVPINKTGRYNLENISTDMVEKVEVIRGGGAVLYGSEAAGGVINIITKGKRDNSVKTSWGNYQQQEHAISVQAGDLGLSYNYSKLGNVNDMSDPAGGRPVGNYYNIKRSEHNNVDARYNINDKMYFKYGYNDSNSHYVYRYKPQGGATNKDVFYTVKEHMAQFHYDDKNYKGVVYYTYKDHNNFTESHNSTSKKVGKDTIYTYLDSLKEKTNSGYKEKSIGLDVQRNWKLGNDSAILGVTAQKDMSDYHEDTLTIKTNKLTGSDRSYERDMYSIYGNYNWAMSKASNLSISARETITRNTQAEDSTKSYNGQNFNKFTSEAQYLAKLNQDTSFYAKAAQSFMMPTFNQMFGSGIIIGNADLKPQHGVHYEMGLKKNIQNQAWRLAVYNYKIKDGIESKWTDKTYTGLTYTNEDIRNTGIELDCQIDMGKGLKSNWGLSYSKPEKYSTTTEHNIETKGRWRDYYGRVQFNGGVSYDSNKFMSALNFNYICKRTRDVDAETPMKPYLMTNLHFSYKPVTNCRIFLNVDNLLDRKDITTAATSSFYTLGRNFMAGCEWKF